MNMNDMQSFNNNNMNNNNQYQQYHAHNPTTLALNPCTLSNGSNTSASTITPNSVHHNNNNHTNGNHFSYNNDINHNNMNKNNHSTATTPTTQCINGIDKLQIVTTNYNGPCNNINCSHLSHMTPIQNTNNSQLQSVYEHGTENVNNNNYNDNNNNNNNNNYIQSHQQTQHNQMQQQMYQQKQHQMQIQQQQHQTYVCREYSSYQLCYLYIYRQTITGDQMTHSEFALNFDCLPLSKHKTKHIIYTI